MAHDITVRKIPFDYSETLAPHWHPQRLEWSHMVNGASLAMPYLEPFLNRTMREAMPRIDDPHLRADMEGFVRQEAQHYRQHRQYNEMLKANGYPELEQVEETFDADYQRLDQRSLEWRLAYSAGFETMTMGITEWLINDRTDLFYNADPVITSLVLWHMVEETEHKSVAYDAYQSVCGRYGMRIAGLLAGSLHVGFMSRRAYIAMLKKDGQWWNPRSRLRLWKMVGCFFAKAGKAMVRALHRDYHPDKIRDPDWVADWSHAFANQAPEKLPLLNTLDREIPPQFT